MVLLYTTTSGKEAAFAMLVYSSECPVVQALESESLDEAKSFALLVISGKAGSRPLGTTWHQPTQGCSLSSSGILAGLASDHHSGLSVF